MQLPARCFLRLGLAGFMALVPFLIASHPALAGSILDSGDVTTSGGVLRIGDIADGVRVVDGMSDGAYSGTVIGSQRNVSGELRLQNSAEYITSGDLVLGEDGNAALRIESGSRLLSESTVMGSRSGVWPDCCQTPVYGSIQVAGIGSEWVNSGSFTIGDQQIGANHEVHVSDGGSLSSNGVSLLGPLVLAGPSSFSVLIEGPGSSWVNTGSLTAIGNFFFTLKDGARAKDRGVSVSSDYSSSRLTIDGSGTEWRTGSLHIGTDSGYGGGLVVQNGGTVLSDAASLTTQTGQTMRIDGPGSSWQIAASLAFGGNGAGGGSSVEVTNGGLVRTGETRMTIPTGFGGILVDGPNSRWISDGAAILGGGETSLTGLVTISNGGVFESGAASLSCNGGLGGTISSGCAMLIDGEGSTFFGREGVYVGGDAAGPQAPGLLRAQNGGDAVADGAVVVWTNGSVEVNDGRLAAPIIHLDGGALKGAGVVDADIENRGRVTPTAGGTPLRVTRDYLQANTATLEIELRPDGRESSLEILGHSVLAGTLSISLASGFSPQPGDEFTVMRYASYGGLFDSYSGLDLGGGLALAPELTTQSLVLRVIPEPSTALLTAIGLALLAGRSRNHAGQLSSTCIGVN